MNECNFLHHYKWNGGNLYFQFNFLKSQNIYLNFNISQKYPSFLTFFWKVGLGLGCIWQQFCQSDPEYIRFACNAKFICSGTRSSLAQRRYVYAVKYSAIIIIKSQRIYRRHVQAMYTHTIDTKQENKYNHHIPFFIFNLSFCKSG